MFSILCQFRPKAIHQSNQSIIFTNPKIWEHMQIIHARQTYTHPSKKQGTTNFPKETHFEIQMHPWSFPQIFASWNLHVWKIICIRPTSELYEVQNHTRPKPKCTRYYNRPKVTPKLSCKEETSVYNDSDKAKPKFHFNRPDPHSNIMLIKHTMFVNNKVHDRYLPI